MRAPSFAAAPVTAGALAFGLAFARPAAAATQRFEPTDLSFMSPGVLQLDLQLGAARSAGPWRVVVPDAEVNLGLTYNVELDADFAFGIEGAPDRGFTFHHVTADNLWLSAKLGLWDTRNEQAGTAWAVGAQIGPKLPLAPGARGIGYEALMLIGRTMRGTHLVLNAGALVDPGAEVSRKRPIGIELGIDLDQDLDKGGRFSILGELGGIHWFTGDPDQLQATAAFQWSASEVLDLSIGGLVGLPPGSDRYAVLLGVSPKLRLWQ
jgi:hypothetical protein